MASRSLVTGRLSGISTSLHFLKVRTVVVPLSMQIFIGNNITRRHKRVESKNCYMINLKNNLTPKLILDMEKLRTEERNGIVQEIDVLILNIIKFDIFPTKQELLC